MQQLTQPLKGGWQIWDEEECMQLLWWMMIGLVAGWLAGKILKGDAYGPSIPCGISTVLPVGLESSEVQLSCRRLLWGR